MLWLTFKEMKTSKYGEMVFDESDLCDLIMQGHDIVNMPVTVEPDLDLERIASILEEPDSLIEWTFPYDNDIPVPAWDAMQQRHWFMPDSYRDMDIAEHVLNLCSNDVELQRVGQELLMYQERGLFDLLKYLTYLVDTMRQHQLIWGVGRGSSVASYVLYKLDVHKIDSIFYDLDIKEFLR